MYVWSGATTPWLGYGSATRTIYGSFFPSRKILDHEVEGKDSRTISHIATCHATPNGNGVRSRSQERTVVNLFLFLKSCCRSDYLFLRIDSASGLLEKEAEGRRHAPSPRCTVLSDHRGVRIFCEQQTRLNHVKSKQFRLLVVHHQELGSPPAPSSFCSVGRISLRETAVLSARSVVTWEEEEVPPTVQVP